jgi:hypothetical protein
MTNIMEESEESKNRSKESGQAIILVLIALGIFLAGTTALAVDFTNLWFHRQAAKGAADAACTAGAQDILTKINNPAFTSPNFTSLWASGTSFDCNSTSNAPCSYASINGYSSNLSAAAVSAPGNTPGNNVYGSFPTGTCPGPSLDPTAAGYPFSNPGSCPAPGVNPASSPINHPFFRVDILERVQVAFLGMFNGTRTKDVRAFAVCGIVAEDSTVPIAVLSPTKGPSLTVNGTSSIVLAGGPQRSIAVNSSDSGAVSAGGDINVVYGGPDYCGGVLTVFGGPSTPEAGWVSSGTAGWPVGVPLPSCGSPRNPQWIAPGASVPDVLAFKAAPPVQPSGSTFTATHGTDGCPDPSGCTEYRPGSYTNISVGGKETAIFRPGIYYITGSFTLDTNSCVRPALRFGACPYCTQSDTAGEAWDSIDGTLFYFQDPSAGPGQPIGLDVKGQGGKCDFRIIDPYYTVNEKCDPMSAIPSFVPATISDSVFVAPCNGDYGDPEWMTGGTPPLYKQRGILLFQNRARSAQSQFHGGGTLLTAGIIYTHRCTTPAGPDAGGTGCVAPTSPDCTGGWTSSTYCSTLEFAGATGSTTFVLGAIITDVLRVTGNSTVAMSLNPGSKYIAYQASLFR